MTARKNWFLNPGFEDGTGAADSWLATGFLLSGFTGAAKTNHDVGYIGSYSQKVEYTIVAGDTGGMNYTLGATGAASFAPSDPESYAFRLKGTIPSGLRVRSTLTWRTNADGSISNSVSGWYTVLNSWQRIYVANAVAPALTDHVKLQLNLAAVDGGSVANSGLGQTITLWFDAAIIEKATSVGTFFSGGLGGAWDGTANASTSQQTQATISSMTPSGSAGSSCTIDGVGFGMSGTVTFAGTVAVITSWSTTEIVCVVPAVSGTPSVVVTPTGDGGGTATAGSTFTIASVTITGLDAGTGDKDHLVAGQTVILNGTQFGEGGLVKIGTAAMEVLDWADTAISCVIPNIPSGATTITVTPTGGNASNAYSVTVLDDPLEVLHNAIWQQHLYNKVRHSNAWVVPAKAEYYHNGSWRTIGLTADSVPAPIPDPPPVPTGVVHTVSTKTIAAVQAAIDAAPKGDTVYCPSGVYTGGGTLTVNDSIYLMGDGIARSNGATSISNGGTWLQPAKFHWGANCSIAKMLIGVNGTQIWPSTRGSSDAGSESNSHGAHDFVFSFVRLRGGGISVLDLSSNYNTDWGGTLKTIDMYRGSFNDVEFETGMGGPGCLMNIWWDARSGGAQIHDLKFTRCHYGVKNSNGVYGTGQAAFLFQPAPAVHAATGDAEGPNVAGGSMILYFTAADLPNQSAKDQGQYWNPNWDWNRYEHGCYNILFTDCLIESPTVPFITGGTTKYAADICDAARGWSMWNGVKKWVSEIKAGTRSDANCIDGYASAGYGNPPGSKWTSIPAPCWTQNVDLIRCYAKGGNFVFEIGSGCNADYSQGISVSHSGSYGNSTNASGGFNAANRPVTALFPTAWTSAYNPSPYDP